MSQLLHLFLIGGLACYLLGTGFAAWAVRTGDSRGLGPARSGAFFGAFFHSALLIDLGVRTGRFPVTGAMEAYLFLSVVIVILALVLDGLRKWTILVISILPLCVITTILALALTQVPAGATKPVPATAGVWTSLHVFTALGAYVAFALAFVSSVLYLIAQRQLKDHSATSILGLIPSLETVARINRRSIAAGVVLLAGGLLVGYLQARDLLGKGPEWRKDPKIYLTTLTLLVYGALFFLSARPTFKGRRTALASALGFFLVMATFWASVFWSDFHRFR